MGTTQEQKLLKFETVKDELKAKIQDRAQELGILEPVTLVDGFINQPCNMEVTNSIIIGGPTIPMIMLLGKSGRIYFFALKAILNI
jgi:hypothetical protein